VDKKIRLPRDGFIDDTVGDALDAEDTEGHRLRQARPDDLTVVPAPPGIGLRRTPGHGGELISDDEDVEGHRLR